MLILLLSICIKLCVYKNKAYKLKLGVNYIIVQVVVHSKTIVKSTDRV